MEKRYKRSITGSGRSTPMRTPLDHIVNTRICNVSSGTEYLVVQSTANHVTKRVYYIQTLTVRVSEIILSDSTKQRTWEACGRSASQEIYLLWNPKVHYRVQSPSLVPILSQINPGHTLSPYLWGTFQYYPYIYSLVFQHDEKSTDVAELWESLPHKFDSRTKLANKHKANAGHRSTEEYNF